MYRRSSYSGDPRWITVKYASKCKKCGADLKKGADAFYYPRCKSLYCAAESCGGHCSADFESAAADEDTYNGQGGFGY